MVHLETKILNKIMFLRNLVSRCFIASCFVEHKIVDVSGRSSELVN